MNVEDVYTKSIKRDEMIGIKDGFHWKSHGRTAMIYFVENNSIIPIDAEMPGVNELDVLVYGEIHYIKRRYFTNNKKWEEIPVEDRYRIQGLLVEWLKSKGLRHNIQASI